jgi:excisionase family DNA binding protein
MNLPEQEDSSRHHQPTPMITEAPKTSHLLTPDETAALLSVTKRTIRNLTIKGLLPCTRITAKIIRYNRVEVEKALRTLTVNAAR